MMEDLIARLYPYGVCKSAEKAIKDPVNSPEDCRRIVRTAQQPPDFQGRQNRKSIASPDDDHNGENRPQNYEAGLELRLSHKLRGGGPGIVFGTDRNSCDIVLPYHTGIARKHFYITFDEKYRLIVRDISHYGTIVTYNNRGRGRRKNFTWIVGGDKVADSFKNIMIEIHPELKFQIVIPKDHGERELFTDNVDHFLKKVTTKDELRIGTLGLQSTHLTTAPSGEETPKQTGIFLKLGTLGEGAFGVVRRVWDVSTGNEYASKRCHNLQDTTWKREADVMRNTSHVGIDVAPVLEILY
jgi:hypothetical protein